MSWPSSTTGVALRTRPISRAMATAVWGWSPVTMITLTPAAWQRAMASGTSGRGGSSRPTRPQQTRSSSSATWSGASSRQAKARTPQALVGHRLLGRHQGLTSGLVQRHRGPPAGEWPGSGVAPIPAPPCSKAPAPGPPRTPRTSACGPHRRAARPGGPSRHQPRAIGSPGATGRSPWDRRRSPGRRET